MSDIKLFRLNTGIVEEVKGVASDLEKSPADSLSVVESLGDGNEAVWCHLHDHRAPVPKPVADHAPLVHRRVTCRGAVEPVDGRGRSWIQIR